MVFDNVDENIVYILGIFCYYQGIKRKVCYINPMTIINKFNQSNALFIRTSSISFKLPILKLNILKFHLRLTFSILFLRL